MYTGPYFEILLINIFFSFVQVKVFVQVIIAMADGGVCSVHCAISKDPPI